jgi:hypothetical protein
MEVERYGTAVARQSLRIRSGLRVNYAVAVEREKLGSAHSRGTGEARVPLGCAATPSQNVYGGRRTPGESWSLMRW